jgi:hypothetical protein
MIRVPLNCAEALASTIFRLLSYDYKFQISTMRYTLLIQVILFTVSSQILAQNVGIGTTNPTEKLHIDNGDLKIGNLVWASASSILFAATDQRTIEKD